MDDPQSFLMRQGVREPIHIPDPAVAAASTLTAFMRFCEQRTGLQFSDQAHFHAFSVADYRIFWRLFLHWSDLITEGDSEPVCAGAQVEHARFFPNLRLNYVETLLFS